MIASVEPIARAELEIASELAELVRVRAFVREMCCLLCPRLAEAAVDHLELAANEVVSNIIIHAYGGRGDQRILVEVELFAERLCVQLWHWGAAFCPGAIELPELTGSRTSGFGLFIVSQCADEVQYRRDAGGRNCVQLVKKIK